MCPYQGQCVGDPCLSFFPSATNVSQTVFRLLHVLNSFGGLCFTFIIRRPCFSKSLLRPEREKERERERGRKRARARARAREGEGEEEREIEREREREIHTYITAPLRGEEWD